MLTFEETIVSLLALFNSADYSPGGKTWLS